MRNETTSHEITTTAELYKLRKSAQMRKLLFECGFIKEVELSSEQEDLITIASQDPDGMVRFAEKIKQLHTED